jgi:hypothetical protein
MALKKKSISIRKIALPIILVIFFSFTTTSAFASDTDTVVVDVDLTNSVVSGTTLTNNAASKLADLTIVNPANLAIDGTNGFAFNIDPTLTTSTPNSYLTGNLGNTLNMKKVVIEMVLKVVDAGSGSAQPAGSMIFGFGSSSSSYVPYNIYHHSDYIGFNTFNSDLYGIAQPDRGFNTYKFVMVRGSDNALTAQQIYLNGTLQSLSKPGALPANESTPNRKFTDGTACSGYLNGDFTVMTHPLGTSWFSRGYIKSLKITTTTTASSGSISNCSRPAISGTTSVGQTLTSSLGTWSPSPNSYAYQWSRANTSSGTYSDISGAISQTYILTSDDLGKFLKVAVTTTNSSGPSSPVLSNATSAISAVAPSAPVINSVTAGDGQLSVNFTAASNGGSAITNYKYSINGSTYIAFSPAVTTSPLVITGLTNSTSYPVTIKAVNAINDSSASNSISATPVAVVVPTDSGGSSSSSSPTPTSTPTPTPTPSASVSVKPRVERINTNPLNIPIPGIEININPIPGNRSNPEQLVKTDVEQLSEILKPKDIDLGKTITDLNFNASKALQFITNTEDKKVVDLASLVTIGGQTQSSRLVIVDNTSAQVVTAAGGVLAVQAKDGVNLVPVNDLGRVQMIRNNTVETQGSGLAPNTEFAVYLFSEPTLLGIGKTDAQGKFFVSFPVTVDLPIGDHTLQINGKLVNGQASSVSMPVSIVETAEVANSKAMPKTILIDVDPVDKALDAVYWLFFVLLVIVLLAVLTNRQKFFYFLYRKKN